MSIMQRRECSLWTSAALGAAVLLSGCGGLEKGPAPNLPYTPEPYVPPAPKAEKKTDVPKGLGPSTQVPIKVEPVATPPAEKKDADKDQSAEPEAKKTDAPAPQVKKDEAPKADGEKPAEPAKAEPKK